MHQDQSLMDITSCIKISGTNQFGVFPKIK